jgi:Beta-lactamase
MAETTFTVDAMKASPNHAEGHRWTPDRTIEVPFDPFSPYAFGPAGNINSTVDEMARWVRLQLGSGSFEGRRIVSAENLSYTRRPKVAVDDKSSYAMGWLQVPTANGTIVFHDGGTGGFGSFLGLLPERDVGLIVLSNEANLGLPVALGMWALDRLLDNPTVDHVATALKGAKTKFAAEEKLFAKPASPRPFPALAPLAGSFASPALGKAALRGEGDALVLELKETGAELALTPWDGDVFMFRLLPRGRFAAAVASMGERPLGFAQFAVGQDGKLGVLRLTTDDGQAYEFRRE